MCNACIFVVRNVWLHVLQTTSRVQKALVILTVPPTPEQTHAHAHTDPFSLSAVNTGPTSLPVSHSQNILFSPYHPPTWCATHFWSQTCHIRTAVYHMRTRPSIPPVSSCAQMLLNINKQNEILQSRVSLKTKQQRLNTDPTVHCHIFYCYNIVHSETFQPNSSTVPCIRLWSITQQLRPPVKLISSQKIGSTWRDSLPRMVCHIKWKSFAWNFAGWKKRARTVRNSVGQQLTEKRWFVFCSHKDFLYENNVTLDNPQQSSPQDADWKEQVNTKEEFIYSSNAKFICCSVATLTTDAVSLTSVVL